MSTKKAVVLLSGGLDSTTCLAYACAQGYTCYALSFSYQQKQASELKAAQSIAKRYAVKQHEIISLDLQHLTSSALTDASIEIPNYKGSKEIPLTYVPARNTIMLSIALGWAETLDAQAIFIGASSIDYSGYPDCRPAYIQAFQNMADLATKRGVEGNPIMIEAPLLYLSKAATIELGLSLGVDYSEAISCYRATDEGLACARCDSCTYRMKGFKEAQVPDPTRYVQT